MNVCEDFRVHKQRRRGVVRRVPYPGGVGGPATRPAPYRSYLRLASVFSKDTRSLGSRRKYFEKTLAIFGDVRGFPPIVTPEGGLALPRVKPGVPRCSCTSEPSRVRKVPKNKQVKLTSLLFREIENASTNNVQIAQNSKDRSDVAPVCSRR